MRQVIVMSGITGSGKSTYAKKLTKKLEEDLDPKGELRLLRMTGALRGEQLRRAFIASADDFFTRDDDGEYVFEPTKIGEAHAKCFRDFLKALNAGIDLVIVDNTNMRAMEIAPYMLAATASGYEAEVIRITSSDPEACWKRNTHGVPLEAALAMQRSMEELPPWWKTTKLDGDTLFGKKQKKFVNLTPHALSVWTPSSSTPYNFPPSGKVARVEQTDTPAPQVHWHDEEGTLHGIPCVVVDYGEVEGLPPPEKDTIYIVSALVRLAVPGRRDVVSPGSLIRGEDGYPKGCQGFTISV